jgi:hypothetical protein
LKGTGSEKEVEGWSSTSKGLPTYVSLHLIIKAKSLPPQKKSDKTPHLFAFDIEYKMLKERILLLLNVGVL